MRGNIISVGKVLLLCAVTLGLTNITRGQEEPPVPPVPAPDAPVVQVWATDPMALKGASSAAFTFVRRGAATADLVVHYALSGTATNGVDYVQIQDQITIPANYLAVDLVIGPLGDSKNWGNKTVVLTLVADAAYQLREHKKAVVTLVDDLFNNAPPTVTMTSPTDGAVFVSPAEVALEANATDADDAIKRVSFYANDRYLGQVTSSPFTWVWTNPPPGAYALFARATDEAGKSSLSAPVHIRVTNTPPTIKLLSPTAGETFSTPANVKLEAEATDSDGAVVKVQFYGDKRLLGTVTNTPYALVWSNVPPGKHVVLARAVDSAGQTATAEAQFTVKNDPPAVRVLKPVEGANFTARADIALEAEATDTDGAISRVSFYANNRYLGTVYEAPYAMTWKWVGPGVYRIKAAATDYYGARTVSTPVLISVSR